MKFSEVVKKMEKFLEQNGDFEVSYIHKTDDCDSISMGRNGIKDQYTFHGNTYFLDDVIIF